MRKLTITEALSETKLIKKKIDSKKEFIKANFARQGNVIDPYETEGGSRKKNESELQAIKDLESDLIEIRNAINEANKTIMVALGGREMSIAEWLVYRRDVLPERKTFYQWLQNGYANLIKQGREKDFEIKDDARTEKQVTINVNQKDVQDEIERLIEIEENLDAKLSLINATSFVEVPD